MMCTIIVQRVHRNASARSTPARRLRKLVSLFAAQYRIWLWMLSPLHAAWTRSARASKKREEWLSPILFHFFSAHVQHVVRAKDGWIIRWSTSKNAFQFISRRCSCCWFASIPDGSGRTVDGRFVYTFLSRSPTLHNWTQLYRVLLHSRNNFHDYCFDSLIFLTVPLRAGCMFALELLIPSLISSSTQLIWITIALFHINYKYFSELCSRHQWVWSHCMWAAAEK